MTTSISTRTQCIIVLLVLLIHAMLLLFLFLDLRLIDSMPSPACTQEQVQIPQPYKNEWAELKPRAGEFAEVIFQDETFLQNSFGSPGGQTEQSVTPIESAQEDIQETAEIPLSDAQEQETKPDQLTAHEDLLVVELAPKKQSVVPQKPESAQKTQPQKATNHKKVTLADITKGFLNQMRNDGNATIAMSGKKGIKPPEEQIVYQRFLEKVYWQMQNSFKIYKHSLSLYNTTKGTVEIFAFLDVDGSLKELKLIRSCGNPMIDQFLLFVVKDASSSFPTLPKNSSDAFRSLPFIINIDIPHCAKEGSGLNFSLI